MSTSGDKLPEKQTGSARSAGKVNELLSPKPASGILLRLMAKMFRQHSDLFLQQAAVMERVATHPEEPSTWDVAAVSPENIRERLMKENVNMLSIKAYESMLQVQKRLDYLEALLKRNGVKPRCRKHADILTEEKLLTAHYREQHEKRIWNAFSVFQAEEGLRIAAELGFAKYNHKGLVHSRLLKMWATMNPQERLPYLKAAEYKNFETARNKERVKELKARRAHAQHLRRSQSKKAAAKESMTEETSATKRKAEEESADSSSSSEDDGSDDGSDDDSDDGSDHGSDDDSDDDGGNDDDDDSDTSLLFPPQEPQRKVQVRKVAWRDKDVPNESADENDD